MSLEFEAVRQANQQSEPMLPTRNNSLVYDEESLFEIQRGQTKEILESKVYSRLERLATDKHNLSNAKKDISGDSAMAPEEHKGPNGNKEPPSAPT